jgi:hypothetical protein
MQPIVDREWQECRIPMSSTSKKSGRRGLTHLKLHLASSAALPPAPGEAIEVAPGLL